MRIRLAGVLLLTAFCVTYTCLAQPSAPGWGQKAAMLEPISEQTVVEVGGKLYSIAGITGAGDTVATMQVYDVKADKWSYGPPLPVAVNHHMAAAAGGKIYVFGGQSASPTASPFVNTVFEFDPATQNWRARAAMPTARSGGSAAVINGNIYVAGGRPPRGHDFAMYDPVADIWNDLPDLPTARNHLVVVAINNKVYVVGGRFDAGAASPMTDVVEVYDPATKKWSTASSMPGKRGGINGILARGCLHIFGGEGNRDAQNGMFPWHDVYDPFQDRWERQPDMPIPVHGVVGLAYQDNLIFLPGGAKGQGGAGRSDLLQTYRPSQICR
jgi:N-acetylneuraminic acid mutarotase